ncbi:polyserase-2-like [Culex pipiens pallens]|uniref:polyserase-2-like n=1 Tax=Culex pipiens pallens TaxID=42434 RepID=UPI001952B29B|nr:polyserase-2-like [Culex pipiens pallens]
MKSRAAVVVLLFLVGEATPQELWSKCGQRAFAEVLDHGGGQDAAPGQWPWYGSVFHYRTDRSIAFACGGTLISRNHVLTVAVCVMDGAGSLLGSGEVMVRLGTHHQNVLHFGNARYRRVKSVHLPKDGEIAILKLTEDVKFNKYVLSICMMVQPFDDQNAKLLVGWGVNGDANQLGSYLGNDTCHFRNDRASIGVALLMGGWFLQYFTHCSGDVITLKRYESWIAKTTNLIYLQKLRSGQDFNSTHQYPQLLPRRHCGKGLIDGEKSTPNATLYEFPWIAKLFNRALGYNCLGTLISHRYVLTSENCINFYFIPDLIVLGEYDNFREPDCQLEDPTDCAPPLRLYEVDYVVRNRNDYRYRIDLIRTTENVAFEDHIQPVCLPLTSELKHLRPSEYTIAGWNKNSKNTTGIIQKETIYAASSAECQINEEHLPNNVLLYTTSHENVANRTYSGGPVGAAVPSSGRRFVQLALVIGPVERCVVALDIVPYIDWIRANMVE